jgi:hypothetical protein
MSKPKNAGIKINVRNPIAFAAVVFAEATRKHHLICGRGASGDAGYTRKITDAYNATRDALNAYYDAIDAANKPTKKARTQKRRAKGKK